jgi:hypothetical protein
VAVEPLALLTAYRDETVANLDRAPPAGMAPDPRNANRQLLCRTRYLRDPRDAEAHQIRVDEIGRLRKVTTGDLFETTRMFPGVRGWDRERVDGRALFTLATDGALYAGDGTTLAIGAREWVELARRPSAPQSAATYLPDVLEFWHHSSFVNGAAVLCAGEIATDRSGHVRLVSNHSGHYRPGRLHLLAFLERLAAAGVDMGPVTVEVVVEDPSTPKRRFLAHHFLAARGEPGDDPPPPPRPFTGRY